MFFTLYMLGIAFHSLFTLILWKLDLLSKSANDEHLIIRLILDVYLLIVVMLHAPMVCMQLYAQFKKLCKRMPLQELPATTDRNTFDDGTSQQTGTLRDAADGRSVISRMPRYPPRGMSCCYNLAELFTFRPQSQEYLYD